MDAEESRQMIHALLQRTIILKRRSQEEAYIDKDMGVSKAVWDGRSLSFFTKPLEDDEEVPEGWFRYGKKYWELVK